ncbi:MAG: hypothetical protein ACTSSP_10675 [Candidatus Asgardarchaeia archaeon]
MEKFNLSKKASSSDYAINDKMLEDNRKSMGLSNESQGVVEKNINLSLPTKDKDNTVPLNQQLNAARKNEAVVAITEADMDDKTVAFGEKTEGVTPINAKSEELNQEKLKDYKKAEDNSKRDTVFWDKYVGVQMEGKKTKVKNNIPSSSSQLQNHPDRFKGKSIDKMVMASLKDADAMLFHIYAIAAKTNRDLNDDEKQQVIDITAGKLRLLSQNMVPPIRRSLEHPVSSSPDPVFKKGPDGLIQVCEHDGTPIDNFKSCEEAKANYPEGDMGG